MCEGSEYQIKQLLVYLVIKANTTPINHTLKASEDNKEMSYHKCEVNDDDLMHLGVVLSVWGFMTR